jgi:hypothetical protein
MLTAIGVDGNNQLLPVTFAFVESENTEYTFKSTCEQASPLPLLSSSPPFLFFLVFAE